MPNLTISTLLKPQPISRHPTRQSAQLVPQNAPRGLPNTSCIQHTLSICVLCPPRTAFRSTRCLPCGHSRILVSALAGLQRDKADSDLNLGLDRGICRRVRGECGRDSGLWACMCAHTHDTTLGTAVRLHLQALDGGGAELKVSAEASHLLVGARAIGKPTPLLASAPKH